jgi:hypothetical protein
MSTKTTAKKSNGANSATSKNSKKVVTNKSGKVTGVTIVELNENADQPVTENVTENPANVVATESATKGVSKSKAKTEKKVVASKSAKPVAKKVATAAKPSTTGEKKIRLADTCYHYYRNFLKDFMRSHGVGSVRFVKAPENYSGYLSTIESQKAAGLKALERWTKENPDTKELFWNVKK